MKEKIINLTSTKKDAHIYYSSNEIVHYVNNAVSYIIAAFEQGDHIIIIENDRLYALILAELNKQLGEDFDHKIHFLNNFDYYFSSGSFNPPIIFKYLEKVIQPYVANQISFRIWAHVEWHDEDGILEILREFEKEADVLVKEMPVILLCAYDEERVPSSLNHHLMECHDYIMTEKDLLPSASYLVRGGN